jgi:dihydrofolate reductase
MTAESGAQTQRRVVANISLSLDGRVTGPGGEYDMSWVVPHALTEQSRAHLAKLTGAASTALLGRKNYEGFKSYWPSVADDADADPRDREFARWLNAVEKVVISTTLQDADWQNTRVAADPADTVRQLRNQPSEGDIIVLSSASIMRSLLAAGEVDRLSITLCPELAGGGARLFTDELPGSSWSLTEMTGTDSGAICLFYDYARPHQDYA